MPLTLDVLSFTVISPLPSTSTSTPREENASENPLKVKHIAASSSLVLKLDKPCIIHMLTLYKYKAQTTQLKEFKVFGGLNQNCKHELLHSEGFRNDNKQETFALRHTIGKDVTLPVQYLRIVPLNQKTSIIHMELRGIDNQQEVQSCIDQYNQYRENTVARLCLKHFRQHNMTQPFAALLQLTPNWEHPLISNLYSSLVEKGDFQEVEKILNSAHTSNHFSEYLSTFPYSPKWSMHPKTEDSPGMRGGHQMCIDEETGQIFLFGGWDGTKDLSDFWVYKIEDQKWHLISTDTRKEGGPGPRSCHKICFDEKQRRIYTLGRYIDVDSSTPLPPPSLSPSLSSTSSTSSSATPTSPPPLHHTLHPTLTHLIHAAILPNPTSSSSSILSPHQSLVHTAQTTLASLSPAMSSLLQSVSLSHQQHHLHTQQQGTTPGISSSLSAGLPSLSLSSGRTITTARSLTSSHSHSLSSLMSPDFFYYDIEKSVWVKVSEDTHKDGGPGLIFDHQMVIDSKHQIIYVFGGKTISANGGGDHYSGLYSYNIESGTWKLLRDESNAVQPSIELRSRIGHCMLFDHISQKLFIFAGQRCKDYLCDFYEYSIDNDEVVEISRDSHRMGGPEGGFTQRSTIDPVKGEIYVLSGLMREKNASVETVKNSFWVYHVASRKWNKIYQNENTGHQYWNTMQNTEPRPRFAHQLVYDSKSKMHYLFGGNPGETDYPHERLDDFWSLQLTRPGSEFVLSRALFILRKQQYFEMCSTGDQLNALSFLREKVATVVPKEDMSQFNSLAMSLFIDKDAALDVRSQRTKVFEQLLQFFPIDMRPPSEDLMDCID